MLTEKDLHDHELCLNFIGSLVHRATEMRRLVVTRLWICAVELTNQREAFCWIWAQCEVTVSEINRRHLALSICGPRISVVIKRSVKISVVNLSDFDCTCSIYPLILRWRKYCEGQPHLCLKTWILILVLHYIVPKALCNFFGSLFPRSKTRLNWTFLARTWFFPT